MIYLQNYKYTQFFLVPKSYPAAPGPFCFALRSTIDNTTEEFKGLEDESKDPAYYGFSVKLGPDFQQGEYVYEISNATGVLARGLAVVKFDPAEFKEYEQNSEYKQYEGD